MSYLAYHIQCADERQMYELITELDSDQLLGFEEQEMQLSAFYNEAINVQKVEQILQEFGVDFKKEHLAHQNWNELWESNFDPVRITDFCYIYAYFHEPEAGFEHSIRITPKMSFGTGHHATTEQMVLMMRTLNFEGKRVLDFGTGTGILAILAQQLGAANVLAIDNDAWSYENALENCDQNQCERVNVQLGSLEICEGQDPYDIILANINLHILQRYMPGMKKLLRPEGVLLISGLLLQDLEKISLALSAAGLQIAEKIDKNKWMCIKAVCKT